MELHPGQTTGGDSRHNFVESRVHKNAVFLQLRGQLFRDLPNLVSFDPPWTWSKNKAYRVRATLGREKRIFQGGVAANFDPHGLSLAHG